MILDAYVQPEVIIDLTTDEDEPQPPALWLGEWVVLDEIDGLSDVEDLPESEPESHPEDEDQDNFAEAPESDYDSHSGSDYSTSESEDSGIDFDWSFCRFDANVYF